MCWAPECGKRCIASCSLSRKAIGQFCWMPASSAQSRHPRLPTIVGDVKTMRLPNVLIGFRACVQMGICPQFDRCWREQRLPLQKQATRVPLTDPVKRPPASREPPKHLAEAVPASFDLDVLFSQNLRCARRGAAGGPSGMTSEHLRPCWTLHTTWNVSGGWVKSWQEPRLQMRWWTPFVWVTSHHSRNLLEGCVASFPDPMLNFGLFLGRPLEDVWFYPKLNFGHFWAPFLVNLLTFQNVINLNT